MAAHIEAQYLGELDERYVGYSNQTPLAIFVHLTKTWVCVQNHKMVACIDAFSAPWANFSTC